MVRRDCLTDLVRSAEFARGFYTFDSFALTFAPPPSLGRCRCK